jgi:hypothetical protein
MSSGEEKWKHPSDILRTAAEFHPQGEKLVRLEFPPTEVQHFRDVAIVWSNYVVETEADRKQSASSRRVTEIFVWQAGTGPIPVGTAMSRSDLQWGATGKPANS